MKGWATSDAVHRDDLPRVVAAFTHSITTGTPYDIEHRCRRADGVYRWFQVRALPVRDTANRITGWYVLLTDIDDRKRAEDGLRASERDLRSIINTIPITGLVGSSETVSADFSSTSTGSISCWPLGGEQARDSRLDGATIHPG